MTKRDTHERAIVGAILKQGKFYTAGDEDALASVLSQSDLDRHVASGQLTGDWSAASAVEPASDEPTSAEHHAPAKRAATSRRK